MASERDMIEYAEAWIAEQLTEGWKFRKGVTKARMISQIIKVFEKQRLKYARDTAFNTGQTYDFAYANWGIDYADDLEPEDYFDR